MTVTDANGKAVEATKNEDGTYTFTQPSGKVKIDVTYKADGEAAPAPAPDGDAFGPYTDLDAGAWYAAGIRYALENGVMSGYGDGLFGPQDMLTREQLVTILYRYARFKGLDVSAGEDANLLGYDDAGEVSEWAAAALRWAVGSGLVNGKTATTLNPQDSAARAEIATVIMRYCENHAK